MLILIKIEEYFRKRKLKNQEKVFRQVQQIVRQIDSDKNGSDGTISALACACNYETFYFTLIKILAAVGEGKRSAKGKEEKKFYKEAQKLFGYLKFVLDYYGGTLGVLWL